MVSVKRAKKFFKRLKKGAGFTLVEVTAVVAITGTLAAIIVPIAIDQIEKARIAKAEEDINTIRTAINIFFSDTGEWPDRTATSPDGVQVLRSGIPELPTTYDSTVSVAGEAPDPLVVNANTGWDESGLLFDELVNHLTMDNPGGAVSGVQPNDIYRTAEINWNGPYMPEISNDPWGRNYLVYARAFTQPTTGGLTPQDIYVWIISAGPNETLETDVNSPTLNNNPDTSGTVGTVADDIGVMIFRSRELLPGL